MIVVSCIAVIDHTIIMTSILFYAGYDSSGKEIGWKGVENIDIFGKTNRITYTAVGCASYINCIH